jgi:hypothetical protein
VAELTGSTLLGQRHIPDTTSASVPTVNMLRSNLQGVHPVVLAYIFFTVRHNTTIIYVTCANGFIRGTISARGAIIR